MGLARRDWKQLLREMRGERRVIETDLTPYRRTLDEINTAGGAFAASTDGELTGAAAALRARALDGVSTDDLLVEAFALAREAAWRVLGLRPYDEQVLAGIALHRGELAEVQTGEGKTLAAVLPVFLNALTGRGVHVLTFNDYLARRDAEWMGPIYRWLGLSVAAIQQGLSANERRAAYAADVTYATAKEAGFDYLRMQLCRESGDLVQRPFQFAIVDEADSILIDEARVPLVIAGQRLASPAGLTRITEVVRGLECGTDFETDDEERNVVLSDRGIERVEAELGCDNLHAADNYLLLTEVNQALHAHVLFRRNVDYIVRDGAIELVDEFSGRVVHDRRWPDGLQAALETKEGLAVRPGGRILGSITLPHFLRLYPRLSGMTATAQPAADELMELYGLRVVPIPPHRPCVRRDLPDVVFTHQEVRSRAMVAEIARVHGTRRPVLVGTASVEASERLAADLRRVEIDCRVLNARNDEQEAAIIAEAGAVGAVTISTNMAGRGTDIRLGGADETDREQVVALGGLCVIGTTRHESQRIDDQLRGRAGRQGEPGTSCFFVSLDDELMLRFGIDELIPAGLLASRQDGSIGDRQVGRRIDQLQRWVEAQSSEIRLTLCRYSALVERQRRILHDRRLAALTGAGPLELCALHAPARYAKLKSRLGPAPLESLERQITLHELDRGWEEHLAHVAHLREGIHLLRIGGLRPLEEFQREIAPAFGEMQEEIDRRIVSRFESIEIGEDGVDLDRAGLRGPGSTWTYLINDGAAGDVHELLVGPGNFGIAAVAGLTVGPLLVGVRLWQRLKGRRSAD